MDARALDRKETRQERSAWYSVRKAEAQYARVLMAVARQCGLLVRGMGAGLDGLRHLEELLRRYAEVLRPWAAAVANRMLADVSRRDETAWRRHGKELSRGLQAEIASAPTGAAMQALQAAQVGYITSLPLEAATRVQRLALEAMSGGERAVTVERAIMATGAVTASRAKLIARTEVAKAASTLVQARAEHIGSEGYIWRTAGDRRVRPLHRKLNGRYIRWDEPPIAGENGERSHAGQIYNCRCICEPVIPEEL
jgi:SPP1 gp7 family putative phage head morphogenesis protein